MLQIYFNVVLVFVWFAQIDLLQQYLLHSSSSTYTLFVDRLFDLLRHRLAMQYSIQVPSRSLRSTFNRDLLHSSSNTYTLSEDRLLDQSIPPGRDTMQYSI
ncbi:hypothetical protein GIB67_033079 [Kingdonia uniflora]|uniref:Uncharacterized protein n=1 Tax=Kingdonia uniflora TaxID=39325 RepID=A0A7J7MYJ5_9MAGN|nr:hypothetical protein GIB67_033079 [Kingdonia uniflora]